MNRLLTAALSAFALTVSASAGAESLALGAGATSRPTRTITANPLGLAVGVFNVEYEQATSEKMTFFVGPQYYGWSLGQISLASYGVGGGLRFFVSGTAPEGFFVSPGLSIAYASADFGNDVSSTAAAWSLTGLAGYTWIFGDVFDLSLGLGAQYMSSKLESGGREAGFSGVLPALRFSLGAAF